MEIPMKQIQHIRTIVSRQLPKDSKRLSEREQADDAVFTVFELVNGLHGINQMHANVLLEEGITPSVIENNIQRNNKLFSKSIQQIKTLCVGSDIKEIQKLLDECKSFYEANIAECREKFCPGTL